MSDKLKAKDLAMAFLVRREHARAELASKLIKRGCLPDIVEAVLTELEDEGLLSDERFAEAYVRARRNKGFGPERVRQELRQKSIADELLEQCLAEDDELWLETAAQVWRKRFGVVASTFKEKAKQMHFLQYRGFTSEQIKTVVDQD